MNCARCKKDAYFLEPCDYCSRIVCRNCEKSSLTASKTKRRIICKDCWGDMKKRTAYKTPLKVKSERT